MVVILKIRYVVITLPTIVRLLQNVASICKMIWRWRNTRQNRNRNTIPTWRPSVFPNR